MSNNELVYMAIYTIILLGIVALKAYTDTYNDRQKTERRQETEQRLEQLEQAVQALMLESKDK